MPPVNNPQVDKVPNSQSNSVHKSEEVIFKASVKPIEKIRAKLLKTALPEKFIIFRIV